MFNVTIMSPRRVLFEGKAGSVFLRGDKGEFEILDYHAPVMSVLKEGDVLLDWKKRFHIAKGIVRFYNNECFVIAEE